MFERRLISCRLKSVHPISKEEDYVAALPSINSVAQAAITGALNTKLSNGAFEVRRNVLHSNWPTSRKFSPLCGRECLLCHKTGSKKKKTSSIHESKHLNCRTELVDVNMIWTLDLQPWNPHISTPNSVSLVAIHDAFVGLDLIRPYVMHI